ncbi:hypothetical protein I315_06658 [Cryptococcus gattii Ru294]|nr:hypothetical protein I315_06658 [Cryptococcus gattii Ru294]
MLDLWISVSARGTSRHQPNLVVGVWLVGLV